MASIRIRRLFAAAAVALVPLLAPALAQAAQPFVFNGKTFADQKAYIDSGARCSTQEPSQLEQMLLAAPRGATSAPGWAR
jgi:hypothetical protein